MTIDYAPTSYGTPPPLSSAMTTAPIPGPTLVASRTAAPPTVTPLKREAPALRGQAPEVSILDDPQYPAVWSSYIGQEKAKRQLRLAAASAKARGVSMPHTLLACGIGGVGKPALAGLGAREMGTNVKVISGQPSIHTMRKLMLTMEDGDSIFIDEVHQLVSGGRVRAEWLLHYLQDGVLLGPSGPLEVPAVTIIAATTEVGKLPSTIVSRFMVPALCGYSAEEATLIAQQMAAGIFEPFGLSAPSWGLFAAVASAGNCNPRAMRQMLCTVRDIALVEGLSVTGAYDIADALDLLEITPDGLTLTMRRYLTTLHDAFDGAAGASTLCNLMQEPGGLIDVERVLQDKGLITLTPRGRQLTDKGVRRAQLAGCSP